jgi:hypothetical protein
MRMLVGLLIVMIISVISNLLVFGQFMDASTNRTVLSMLFTTIIFFTIVFPNATFIVPADTAWILENPFKPEIVGDNSEEFSGYREIRAQTEFQAGFHWKYPWERFLVSIDMKRTIIVEGDKKKTYTMGNGNTVMVQWQFLCTPLPGCLINYNRSNEEDIRLQIKTRVERWLQGKIGSMSSVSFGKAQIDEFKESFEFVFGGPKTIDEMERKFGIWAGTPEIFYIGNPPKIEEGKNFAESIGPLFAAAKDMVTKAEGGLSYEAALKIASMLRAAESGGEVSFVDIAGAIGQQKKKGGGNGEQRR